MDATGFNPGKLAVLYYFGDLQYWKLPGIALEAFTNGYDGPTLRRLAEIGLSSGSVKSVAQIDVTSEDWDSAFLEMGVSAPLSRKEAGLSLATEAARRAIHGNGNVFDEATHIRVYILGEEPMPELRQIAELSLQAKRTPRSNWGNIEIELRAAMEAFLNGRDSVT